jgi:hypothetical protein
VPWQSALHTVDGIPYLRPELALLHKAHLDRPKDKADLAAARLDPDARAWLAQTLDQLGHHSWANAARSAGLSPRSPFRSRRALTWKCEHWPSGAQDTRAQRPERATTSYNSRKL